MNRLMEKTIIIYLNDEYSCSESIFAEGKAFNIFKFTFPSTEENYSLEKMKLSEIYLDMMK